jgi:hypothetical protein
MSATGSADVPDEERYATLLEEAFIAERRTPFLLSAKDWTLIRGFREKGIPPDTAIRAIRETFEKRRARGGTGKISSIAYCENAIEERWEMERRGLVGSHDAAPPPPPEATAPLLAGIAAKLEGAVAPADLDASSFSAAVAKALAKVRAIPDGAPFEEIEEALGKIETSLLKGVRRSFPAALDAEVSRRVDEALGAPGDVPETIRERTRRAIEKREVRRTAGLPPLTLLVG